MISQDSFEFDIRSQTSKICNWPAHNKKALEKALKDEEVIDWFNCHEHKKNPILHEALLISASFWGRAKVVDLLLKLGIADPTDNDCTAICYSIRNGHNNVLDLFLKHKSFKKVFLSQLSKSINIASEYGHADVLDSLMKDGRISLFDSYMCNPISTGIRHSNVVKLFIINAKPSYPYNAYVEALNHACKDGNNTIVTMLLDGIKITKRRKTETHRITFENGDLLKAKEIAESMIKPYFTNRRYTKIIQNLSVWINKNNAKKS